MRPIKGQWSLHREPAYNKQNMSAGAEMGVLLNEAWKGGPGLKWQRNKSELSHSDMCICYCRLRAGAVCATLFSVPRVVTLRQQHTLKSILQRLIQWEQYKGQSVMSACDASLNVPEWYPALLGIRSGQPSFVIRYIIHKSLQVLLFIIGGGGGVCMCVCVFFVCTCMCGE